MRQVSRQWVGVSLSRGLLTDLAEVILLAVGLYLVVNFAIQTVHVMGSSMYPTVRDQNYLIATKIDYHFRSPQRGDIIIMRDPLDPSKDFIKRIVAVPGDRILIRNGHVYLNGHELHERYLNPQPWTQYATWPTITPTSPEGELMGPDEYFVMGDNRNSSSDSRIFGPIHRDQIEARAWIRILPLTEAGPVT